MIPLSAGAIVDIVAVSPRVVFRACRTTSPRAGTAACTSFSDADDTLYRDLFAEHCRAAENRRQALMAIAVTVR